MKYYISTTDGWRQQKYKRELLSFLREIVDGTYTEAGEFSKHIEDKLDNIYESVIKIACKLVEKGVMTPQEALELFGISSWEIDRHKIEIIAEE